MENQEFYITDDGIRLHAKLDFPENMGEKCPLTILFHGFTGHMEEAHIHAIKRANLENGCAVLRVDLYGHGKSDGEFRNHTLFKWIGNALTVVEYVKKLDFVTDLYLAGHSQGGLLTVLIGGMMADDFKAIMPISPALMIPEGARSGSLLGMEFDPHHIPDLLEREDGLALNGNYLRAAQCLYPEQQIRAFSGPVLIVHSDTDEAVPYEDSVRAQKQYADCRLVNVENDTHCFDHHMDEMECAVREFMKEMVQL